MKANEVVAALRATYSPPEWAVFTEVTDGTGAHASRRADMIAMNLYPSKGLDLRCIEVKVSRSDLAAELRDPDKAETFAQFCDGFWLATPKGLVAPSDLPSPWGLIEVDGGGRARVAKKASVNPSPLPPSRMFMAGLLRAASKVSEKEVVARITTAERAARARTEAALRPEIERAKDQARRDVARARETLDRLLALIGEESDWIIGNPEFVQAIKLVRTSGVIGTRRGIGAAERQIDGAIKALETARAAIAVEFGPQSGEPDRGPK